SRDLEANAAAKVVTAAVSSLLVPEDDAAPRWVYKKIDSMLRGHPRAELLALMAALGESRGVVAPAFPAEGRTTRDGRQYIAGASEAIADLGALFTDKRGLAARRLDLATLRGKPETV